MADPIRDAALAKHKRVAYAEDVLGVHDVYERCQEALGVLADRTATVTETARKRRDIDFRLTEREIYLVVLERGVPAIATLSQAAFDRHMKVVLSSDHEMIELRSSRLAIQHEHELAERDAEIARMTARMESARMEELGGLLKFYAHSPANTTE